MDLGPVEADHRRRRGSARKNPAGSNHGSALARSSRAGPARLVRVLGEGPVVDASHSSSSWPGTNVRTLTPAGSTGSSSERRPAAGAAATAPGTRSEAGRLGQPPARRAASPCAHSRSGPPAARRISARAAAPSPGVGAPAGRRAPLGLRDGAARRRGTHSRRASRVRSPQQQVPRRLDRRSAAAAARARTAAPTPSAAVASSTSAITAATWSALSASAGPTCHAGDACGHRPGWSARCWPCRRAGPFSLAALVARRAASARSRLDRRRTCSRRCARCRSAPRAPGRAWRAAAGRGRRRCGCRRSSRSPRPPAAAAPG